MDDFYDFQDFAGYVQVGRVLSYYLLVMAVGTWLCFHVVEKQRSFKSASAYP